MDKNIMIDSYLSVIKEKFNNESIDKKNDIETIFKYLEELICCKDGDNSKSLKEISRYLKNKSSKAINESENFRTDGYILNKTNYNYDNYSKIKNVRNILFHKAKINKDTEELLYKIVWKLIPELEEFNNTKELNNLLSYFVGYEISPKKNIKDNNQLVKIYKNAFDSLRPEERHTAIIELARTVFSVASSGDIEKAAQKVNLK